MNDRPADNPFASRRIDRLKFRFRHFDTDAVIEKLHRQGDRGAIVGPHGSGKTTLLHNLADRLTGTIVWIRLNGETTAPAKTAFAALPVDFDRRHVVLVDGAEQLGPWAWWRLRRRFRDAGTVIITSHRPGRLPTLHHCTTDPALLNELVRELAPEIVENMDLEGLFHRHDGNIRSCLRELYDCSAAKGRSSGCRV